MPARSSTPARSSAARWLRRRTTGRSTLQSTTVDARIPRAGPPSRTRSTASPNVSATEEHQAPRAHPTCSRTSSAGARPRSRARAARRGRGRAGRWSMRRRSAIPAGRGRHAAARPGSDRRARTRRPAPPPLPARHRSWRLWVVSARSRTMPRSADAALRRTAARSRQGSPGRPQGRRSCQSAAQPDPGAEDADGLVAAGRVVEEDARHQALAGSSAAWRASSSSRTAAFAASRGQPVQAPR